MASKVLALQGWCKKQCHGYRDVEITNMTTSWRSGLAFCAIIHRYHPELIDYDSLDKDNIYENNKLAFDVAETLGISPFLDPEDMAALKVPDKLSILTYVSQYYNVFGKQTWRQLDSKPTTIKRSAEKLEMKSEEAKKKKNQQESISNTRTYTSSEDICHICKSKVYLIERHFDSNHLYHHSCFRSLHTSLLESSYNAKDASKHSDSCPSKSEEIENNSDQQKPENKVVKNLVENKSSDVVSGIDKEKLKSENGVKNSLDVTAKSTAAIDKRPEYSTPKPLSSTKESKNLRDFEKSEHNLVRQQSTTAAITAVKFSPKSSCSDTMLSFTKHQEVKLNEIVSRNYKTEKGSESSETLKLKPQIMDNNSNNRSFNRSLTDQSSSFDTSSSSGSDSTLKVSGGSQVTVINFMTERGDSRRPIPSVLCGENKRLNANSKGKLVNFNDAEGTPTFFPTTSCETVSSISTSSQHLGVYASSVISKFEDLDKNSILRKSLNDPTRLSQCNKNTIPLSTSQQIFPTPRMANSQKPISSAVISNDPLFITTFPQVPPRTFSVFKQSDYSHLEGSILENSTRVNRLIKERETLSIKKTFEDNVPTPTPRRKNNETRHSLGGTYMPSEISAVTANSRPSVDPLPRHKSLLISKKSRSPPPRPPPPLQDSPSSTSLPSILKVHPWPEGHDPKISVLKSPPIKPPRSIVRETNKKTEQSEFQENTNVSLKSSVSVSNDYKPHQVVCSTTFPTTIHPLANPSTRPPPRPSEPPKKKILPQTKFYFESISFEDYEAETLFTPIACKSDMEKNEIGRKLKIIDEKLKEIETEGRILEQVIRSDQDSLSDDNLAMWFNMINDRNELVREETDLRYRSHQLDLEKEQSNIEAKLRSLMMISEKTSLQRMDEDYLIKKLLNIVERRSHIVDSQEDDRIRYLKEDEALKKTRELSLGEKSKARRV